MEVIEDGLEFLERPVFRVSLISFAWKRAFENGLFFYKAVERLLK